MIGQGRNTMGVKGRKPDEDKKEFEEKRGEPVRGNWRAREKEKRCGKGVWNRGQ